MATTSMFNQSLRAGTGAAVVVRRGLTQPRANPRSLYHHLHRQPYLRPTLSPLYSLAAFQRRHASTIRDRLQGLSQRLRIKSRELFRENPITYPLALFILALGALGLCYLPYYYLTYIIGAFRAYPEPVAAKLRRALYFTNIDLNPTEATKYYRQAIEIADEINLDPFSAEIMGIRIMVSELMEKCRAPGNAVEVLETVKADSMEWMRRFGDLPENKIKRSRILGTCCAISLKLGELYASPEVWDRETALERTLWAVETLLKERRRREALNVRDEDEGPWKTDSEIGAAMEALAHKYEETNMHYLAAPLFLQALMLHPTKHCHTVVLMNNLASALAQQSPRAAIAAQDYATSCNITTYSDKELPVVPRPTRESLLANAQIWAKKALSVAAAITPPERTDECDIGCAVATHNLAEFAEMAGDVDEAKRGYLEALSIARAIGFRQGVRESSTRLRKLVGQG